MILKVFSNLNDSMILWLQALQRAALINGPFLMFFWGLELSLQGWRCFSVFPLKTRRFSLSHSESKWWLHSSYDKCHLGGKQIPSKEGCFWGFLLSQPLLVLASNSSFPLRNNRSVCSVHCRFLMSQMQRSHYSIFIFAIFIYVRGSGSGRHWDTCLYEPSLHWCWL